MRPASSAFDASADKACAATGLSSQRCSSASSGSSASHCASVFTAATCSGFDRPHCSAAAIATPCQCARFFSARSPCSRSTERSLISGWIATAPSSQAFSTMPSMRSLAGITTASVTARFISRSTGCRDLSATRTSLRPMAVTAAVHSSPLPSNKVTSSPGCSRSTCTWRAAPGGSASSASSASAPSGCSTNNLAAKPHPLSFCTQAAKAVMTLRRKASVSGLARLPSSLNISFAPPRYTSGEGSSGAFRQASTWRRW